MSQTLTAITEERVRFSEVDSLKVVWHGHYLQYFELGREAFGAKYGMEYLTVYDNGYTIPVVKTVVEHKAPLVYGDSAIIETEYVECAAAKILFKYRITSKNTGKLVATGESVQVFLDKEGDLFITVPDFIQQWKKKWQLS